MRSRNSPRRSTASNCIHPRAGRRPEADAAAALARLAGSMVEFLQFIPRLTDPARFGGDPADAFAVVAPSLPGYAFSFGRTSRGSASRRWPTCSRELMTDVLGYERFGVQGGDWGGIIASLSRPRQAERLIGIHVNFLPSGRDPSALADPSSKSAPISRRLSTGSRRRPAIRDPGHQAADAELRADRFAGGARGLARREIPRLDRLRRRRRKRVVARRRCSPTSASTGSPARSAPRSVPIISASRADGRFRRASASRAPMGYAAFPHEILRPPRSLAEKSSPTSGAGPRCRPAAISLPWSSRRPWRPKSAPSSAPCGRPDAAGERRRQRTERS